MLRREMIATVILLVATTAHAGVVRGHTPRDRTTRAAGPVVWVEGRGNHVLALSGRRAQVYLHSLYSMEHNARDGFQELARCAISGRNYCLDRSGINTLTHVSEGDSCAVLCNDGTAMYYDDGSECRGVLFTGECCHKCWTGAPCDQDCDMDGCADNDFDCCSLDDPFCETFRSMIPLVREGTETFKPRGKEEQ